LISLRPAAQVLSAVVCLNFAGAVDAQQKVDPARSEVAFVARQMGVPVEGRFGKFDAQIALDARKPEAGRISFTIDLASASMGVAEVDVELRKPSWFHTSKFPQARFDSTAIKSVAPGRFEVAGKLAIKGVTREVVIPVTLAQTGTAGVASGAMALQRLAFKVGDGEWADTSVVADEVQVKFKLAISGL